MSKQVKFNLVFRDLWQSSGKYQPRVDQLLKVAPAIVKMGCFDRVETNGGGFEQGNRNARPRSQRHSYEPLPG